MPAPSPTAPARPGVLLAVAIGVHLGLIGVLPDAAALVVVAVLLVAAVATGVAGAPARCLRRVQWVALGFVAAATVSILASGPALSGLHSVARFSLFPLTVLAVGRAREHDSSIAIWVGATVGASAAGLVALAEVVLTEVRRPAALTNPILFGGFALVLGFLSVALAPLVVDRVPSARRVAAVAAGLGILASLLAQARGSWLALPVLATVAGLAFVRSGGSRRALAGVVIAGIVLVPVGLSANQGAGFDALWRAVDQTADYAAGTHDEAVRSTSVGARFEAWGSSMGAFVDSPFVGIGWGNLGERFVVDAATGARPFRLTEFEHAHNQFLGSLASGGILGLAALLAVLGVPGRMFLVAFRRGGSAGIVGAAGMVVVAGFGIFGLTEAIFEHSSTLVFYGALVAVLASELDRAPAAVESEHMFA